MTTPTAFLDTWTTAEINADETALDKALTDDFTAIGPLGFTLSKQDWIDRHGPGNLRYESFELTDLTTRTYGEVAVVIGLQHQDATFNGHPLPTTMRASLVLVEHGNDWRLANIQLSFVAGTPGAPPIPGRPATQSPGE